MTINKMFEDIIKEAKFLEVSDIHFSPLEECVSIYYRQFNDLIFQKNIEKEFYNKILRFIKFKAKMDISINVLPQDGSFYIMFDQDKTFIRVSTLPLLNSESLVIRILSSQKSRYFKDLAYNTSDIKNIKENIQNNNGLFIFTGPTGSGKTTVMYSILDEIVKKTSKKVITIENPIEIINENFVQVQINEERNLDYSKTLRAVLRQDPDIIMIGEIRDEETARNVFRATLTGHTVISTMHTKNVYGVIERFLDFGFLKSEIKSIIIGLSNQRLILKDDEIKCVFEYALNNQIDDLIKNKGLGINVEEKIKKIKK